jgi:methylmalonyl-CoA mutase
MFHNLSLHTQDLIIEANIEKMDLNMSTRDPKAGTQKEKLLDEFSIPSLEEWREAVDRLLKGAPYDKIMLTPTHEGLTLQPMYSGKDTEDLPNLENLPGEAPYLRSTKASGYRSNGWFIAQEMPYPTQDEFNRAIRHDLMRGQNAINLLLDEATQLGLDPDFAEKGQVGKGGTSISSISGLSRALEGIDLTAVPIFVQAGVSSLPFAALLIAWMRKNNQDVKKLRGTIGMDPVAGLAILGTLPIKLNRALDEIALLTKWSIDNAPEVKTIEVYGHPYHNAGASSVQEVAIAIATGVFYLREMTERGISVDDAAQRIYFAFSTGSKFFMEIAKFRAARLLWARVVEAAGGNADSQKMFIHARTSEFNKTVFDPHVNLLRSTTEAFSAVIGGVDSLHVAPFDEPLGLPNDLSRRIARNTHIILSEESHFDSVIDPAGGSWYIEKLTNEFAETTWKLFQDIEGKGGVFEALKKDDLHNMIKWTRAGREKSMRTRKDIFVGTNQYPNSTEILLDENLPDYEKLHAERSAQLKALRTSSEHEEEIKVLKSLQAIIDSDFDSVFEEMINAALRGATLGEFTRTMRFAEAESVTVDPLPTDRAAKLFEDLRIAVEKWRIYKGDAPQIFLANIGHMGRYMPRVDFTKSFFQVGGFTVEGDKSFETAEAAIEAANESGANVIVVVSTDDKYPESVPAIAEAFKKIKTSCVYVAGYPKEHIDAFTEAGVDQFINVKSDVYSVLNDLAESLEVFK